MYLEPKGESVLFHKEDCYKIEWIARQNVYLAVNIEHYFVCSFDTESYVFFEAIDMLHQASIMYGIAESDEDRASSWCVVMAEKEAGLRQALSTLIHTSLSIGDVIQIKEMVDDTVACLFANSTS